MKFIIKNTTTMAKNNPTIADDFEIDEFTKLLGTAAIMMYKTNTERIVSPRRK